MEQGGTQKSEAVLILASEEHDLAATKTVVSERLPSLVVEAVQSIEALRQSIDERQFDVVVIDHTLNGPNPIELIHELRMREEEPAILVVSEAKDARFVADLYNHGIQRCIVKDERWLSELGTVLRQAIREKKLQNRNRELHARLVEANMLLEEKNRRLDEFSATVAHDIRGPLGGLSMKLEYIVETYQGKIDKRCEQLLRTGLGSVERLSRIVQGMYEYAKLGARAAETAELDLIALVSEVINDMHFDASREIKIGIGDLPKVWGNEELLRRVFINLLNNAVKYNDSPEVVINVGVAGRSEQSIAKFVEIFVEDNGRGIPENELKDVFTMFQRGSSAGPETEGTGVGLAVVRRIAELHYGKARVESVVGRGTKFFFSLPTEKIDFLK